MANREPEEGEALCPLCGEEVSVRGDGESPVAVTCPNCGRLEMSKEEFDVIETEID